MFHTPSLEFLGHIVEAGYVRTDPKKVKAVMECPKPQKRVELQRFLGFAGFYRWFIKDYSRIAALISALTSTPRQFDWTPEAQFALTERKKRFSEAPVLAHPDPTRQFVVEVNASESGLGAVLSQRTGGSQTASMCLLLSAPNTCRAQLQCW